MGRVKVFTDSTADLSEELLQKYNISVIPLYVVLNEKSYRDGVDLTTDEMYRCVEQYQMLPKTSAPTTEDFKAAFQPWLSEGYEIVYIGLSSALSGTIQIANLAASELEKDRIHIVDSLNLSTGIGLLVLEAADMANQGIDASEIANKIQEDVPKVRSSFVIDTLKYLHMGGRCTSLQMLANSVLKIRPQIIVRDGGMVVGSKYRGNRKRCWESFYKDHIGDGEGIRRNRVFLTQSGCSMEEVTFLIENLRNELDVEEVLTTEAGIVISSHCGPKTMGILYIQD
ncbi:MAG: DegV family protein [Epulopiscium sp.]|nr:DegV family protein [Candidatus Epulonipiscium sp.]